jgi:hypothetical protein
VIGLLVLATITGLYSGDQLYQKCQSDPLGACTGYIAGVSDTVDLFQETDITKHAICMSGGVSAEQMRDVVIKYLRDHPETRDKAAQFLEVRALMEAFPCPK